MKTRRKTNVSDDLSELEDLVGSDGFSTQTTDLMCHGTGIHGIAWPQNATQVSALVKWAIKTRTNLICQGARECHVHDSEKQTSLVICTRKMQKLLHVDAGKFTATAEAGMLVRDFECHLHALGLEWSGVAALHQTMTLGDFVSQTRPDSLDGLFCPDHKTLLEVELVDALGRVWSFSRHSSPDITGLLATSGGVLGVVTRVKMKVYARQTEQRLLFCQYPNGENALEGLRRLCQSGLKLSRHILMDSTSETLIKKSQIPFNLDHNVQPLLGKLFLFMGRMKSKKELLVLEIRAASANLADVSLSRAKAIVRGLGGQIHENPEEHPERFMQPSFLKTHLARLGWQLNCFYTTAKWDLLPGTLKKGLEILKPFGTVSHQVFDANEQGATLGFWLLTPWPQTTGESLPAKFHAIRKKMALGLSPRDLQPDLYLVKQIRQILDPEGIMSPAGSHDFNLLTENNHDV